MLGWERDEEDFGFLRGRSQIRLAATAPTDFVPPKVMSFRSILKTENQGPIGSCVGHGGSSGMEQLVYSASGQKVQLSRMFCYLNAQKMTGIRGDRGATISGCVQALMTIGICEESVMPYPNPVRYAATIPTSATAAAAKCKILGHKDLNSPEEIWDWISTNQGPVIYGMEWYDNVARARTPIITSDMLKGPSAGGHCRLMAGYSGELGPDGKPLIDDLNSHGLSFGEGGWTKWTWTALATLCQQERNTRSIIGITNATGYDPQRLVNFARIV